jgi:hypothetical protein
MIALPLLIQIWFVFVPPGTRGPELDQDSLKRAILAEMETIAGIISNRSAKEFEEYFGTGPQPVLAGMLANVLLSEIERMPGKSKLSAEKQAVVMAVFRAAISEMDAACRSR